jgi:glycosyltransferase involved in cell wall biosynthesis
LPKLIRITTIPLSLEKLLEGQLTFMNKHYDVIAVSSECKKLSKYGQSNGVNTFCLPLTRKITLLKDLFAVIKLYFFLKKEKPMIVHTHTPKAGIVGMLAAKLAGVPLRLHTVAGLPLLEVTGLKRTLLNKVEKLTYIFATNIYPNSHGLSEIIINEQFTSLSKIKVLGDGSSNGINTNYFNPELFSSRSQTALRTELKIENEDLVYIFIGRLVSEKGINELMNAFEKLMTVESNIKLLLVGPYENDLDPLDETTMKIISENRNVISVGYQADVRPYLAIADILVFPSYREGFPNVVMQAGAMGLASIVSNINGCNEIIEDRINGLIIPVKSEKAIYNAMFELKRNYQTREVLRSNSRQIIVAKYERTKYWDLLLKEYQQLENSIKPTLS